jgi:hypothetical protein
VSIGDKKLHCRFRNVQISVELPTFNYNLGYSLLVEKIKLSLFNNEPKYSRFYQVDEASFEVQDVFVIQTSQRIFYGSKSKGSG